MRNHHKHLLPAVLTCLFFVPGCSRQIVQSENPVSLSADQYKTYFDAALFVLRDNGFVIDRRDYRFGTITTRPLGSPTVFEPWHAQNTTDDQAIESTLSDEQRIVTVTFTPTPQTGSDPVFGVVSEAGEPETYAIEVNVALERKQIATRRLAGSARRNVFSNLAAPPKELADKDVPATYWEPLGHDPYLESRLMKQIVQRVGEQE